LPFSAAILQSQQATTTPATGQANYNQTLSHFGCVNIDCLRRVPALDLKAYIEDEGLAFAPVEDPATFRNDVRPAIRSGSFADVPILMGTNLNEVRVFLGVLGLTNGADAVGQVLSALQLNDTLGQTLIAEYTANGVDDLYAIADR
jgi:carboxylesterase type B